MAEMPAMAQAQYASRAFDPAEWAGSPTVTASFARDQARAARRISEGLKTGTHLDPRDEELARLVAGGKQKPQDEAAEEQQPMARRVVQVFIADPDPKLALADSLVYKGEQHLTDMDDQELFFQVDIRTILAAHNEKRIQTVDKTVKERTQNLEPARIRDLKMVVVTVASF